ncbi:TPA: EpsG family protein [Vibrio parahaemolyticus]
MFLFIILYGTLYLYAIKSVLRVCNKWYLYIPIILITVIPSSLQYGTGTDYFSYIIIYNTELNLDSYINKGEILFPYLIYFLKSMNFEVQSLFFFVSLFNGLLFSLLIKELNGRGYSSWIFFFVFMTCTGVYHNQMNGLRQYMAVYTLPLVAIYLSEQRHVKSILYILYGFFSHLSFVLPLMVLFILKSSFFRRINSIYLFIISLPAYKLLIPFLAINFVGIMFPAYKYYLLADRIEEANIISLITKLYYLPLVLYFYYLLNNGSIVLKDKYERFLILIFSSTYWFFLASQDISILGRVAQYFYLFYSFPLYYIINHFYKKNKTVMFVLSMLYIFIPYVLKVTILAKNEYLYHWILS